MENTNEPIKITRRTFLVEGSKRVGAIFGLAAMPINLPAVRTKSEIQQVETVGQKEWKIEEVLLDPTALLDNISDKIHTISPQDQTDIQKSFLTMFSNYSNDEGFKENNRDILIAGYQKYGEQIIEDRKKITETNMFPGQNIDRDLPFFSKLTRPLANLIEMANRVAPFNLDTDTYNDLLKMTNWFRPSLKGSYEAQKGEYMMMARENVDIAKIKTNIKGEWNDFIKYQRYGKLDGWEIRRRDAEDLQMQIVDIINSNLPLAYAYFQYDSFDKRRGHYNDNGDFISQNNFFFGFNAWLEERGIYKVSEDKRVWYGDVQNYFNRYLLEKLHELGHGVDPLFQNRGDVFFQFHPKDYFNYLAGYLNTFEDFHNLIHGNPEKSIQRISADGIEEWFRDPLAVESAFGVDEIIPDTINEFETELNNLFSLCLELENPADEVQKEKYKKTIKELGLEKLFTKKKEMLSTWKDQLGDEGGFIAQVFKVRISDFSSISSDNINGMIGLFDDTFKKNKGIFSEGAKSNLEQIFIRTKSMYMFAGFVLLERMYEKGDIKENDTFYYLYQNFSQKIKWQLAHAATGPLGEYLRMAYNDYDLRVDPLQQYIKVTDDATSLRSHQSIPETDKNLPPFLARLYKNIIRIQELRVVLWGADTVKQEYKTNPNQVYVDISKQVIQGILKEKDLEVIAVG